MELFWKAAIGALVTVILSLTLAKTGKDFSLLVTLTACCMILLAAVSYLDPLIAFLRELANLGQLDHNMLGALLKTVGIGLLAQIAELVCGDAGNASLGKTLQILAGAVVLWLSIPILRSLLELVQQILGEV